MPRFLNATLLGAALVAQLAITPASLMAADDSRSYHDKGHNDDHHWDSHEDKAYRMWAKEQHRKYVDFHKLHNDDQENYWRWRHDHSDAILKINIH